MKTQFNRQGWFFSATCVLFLGLVGGVGLFADNGGNGEARAAAPAPRYFGEEFAAVQKALPHAAVPDEIPSTF